ncbi:hypothetical protein [Nonomuraea sp. NPDC050691]|uniref:hypothetical protein n=1 Tax=Nonomuraea sp. NPDC050691 TaxID=3155661 RepID=UPI00340DE5B5
MREQVAALEERLSDLATARRVVAPMLAGVPGPKQAPSDGTPDAPTHASPKEAASAPKPVAGVDKQVVGIMASSGRTMRAKEVAQALGEPDVFALLVTVANDHFLDQWHHTRRLQNEPITPARHPVKPRCIRFGNPRNDKIPSVQTGSRQPQSSRFRNGRWWGVHE